jgi:hypothetical protein
MLPPGGEGEQQQKKKAREDSCVLHYFLNFVLYCGLKKSRTQMFDRFIAKKIKASIRFGKNGIA